MSKPRDVSAIAKTVARYTLNLLTGSLFTRRVTGVGVGAGYHISSTYALGVLRHFLAKGYHPRHKSAVVLVPQWY